MGGNCELFVISSADDRRELFRVETAKVKCKINGDDECSFYVKLVRLECDD